MLALFLFAAVCAYCTSFRLRYAVFLEATYTYTAEKLRYNGLAKAKTAGGKPKGQPSADAHSVANDVSKKRRIQRGKAWQMPSQKSRPRARKEKK